MKLITLHYFGFLYFFLQGKRIKPFKMEIPCVCWTVLFQVDTSRSHMIGGKKKLQSKLPSQDWGCRTFFKLVIEGGLALPTVGGAIPGLVVLGSIRKQTEQAILQHPSMASASVPGSRFLPCSSFCPSFFQQCIVTQKCRPNKPFPFQLPF